jgi:putative oxidoreductase
MTGSPQRVIPAFGRIYDALWPVTEPLIRLAAGLFLAAHGFPKLFGETEANVRFFESAGFEPALLWTYAIGIVEFGGGLCLALGFLTRLVCVPILAFLVTAITYHAQFGFYWNLRGFEYPLFWSLVVFHFLVRGGGPWSLDALIGKEL